MSMINIRSDVEDKFYRYKMPKLISKIEGKGNGIKTVIPNMSDIARALSRPPTYPTKYFGCELGAQVKCDETNDRYIVNGAHDAARLQELLSGFISKFVLCPNCKNPETDMIIKNSKRNEDIILDCKACGAQLSADTRHKLATFIVKNPPPKKNAQAVGKKGRDPKGAAHESAEALPTPPEGESAEEEESGNAAEAMMKEMMDEAEALPVADDDEDNIQWNLDTSTEAISRRMKELQVGGAVQKAFGDDDEDSGEDPLETFADFISSDAGVSDQDIIAKAAELELRDDKVCSVLPQVLFDKAIMTQIKTRAPLFNKFMKNEKCQKGLLGGIERLVGVVHPELLPLTPKILHAFYDSDLLEEDVIVAWSEKLSKKYVDKKVAKAVREKAEPFIQWLKEAEEDDDDEDDDEDDE
ncbi:domain found in IF2B/IF5-domain-containing protein [Polychytrium aggregatum]|uniref:domain found in IF2B/IF5-domain-containing protein n=1 Tax=Polychytrium aggregatum TaxID=110093 RepID=UPI0022FE891A|nr:domain found in IF2B/IF5-domain-containing protein [Polychytrium aggregatum]KAI9206656.1 domain found in IF2B/IF5-domain-containing protein [Polychytrium aggregatum]